VTEENAAVPHVQVVRGAPDDVELAALVAGLAAVRVPDEAPPEAPPSAWTDRARSMRRPRTTARPGPDAWRWSLRG
jgi:hypothetical protein